MIQLSSFRPVSGALRSLRFLMAGLLALVVAGCSSTLTRIQTWEGAAADAEAVAVLRTPGEIQVSQVNGRDVGNFLMDDLALDYELLPGRNVVVFKYKTIWAKGAGVENGESKVAVIETQPQQVIINARAGEQYEFVLPEPGSRRQAEALSRNFRAQISNTGGAIVATSGRYEPAMPVAGAPSATTPAGAPVAGAPVSTAPQSMPGGDLPALEAMKVLWERASAEDKREFLRWAFD
ncbi:MULTISPECIES: DUF2057 family protein [Marinobacter]|uniref:DUF2057 family protein n=1 Tax=Marinobacter TaxID=2742 RepID=UPI001D0636D8|nr:MULTISPECIES: DUF2057 family protein [Marinobacter]MCK7568834.1 DUF2057 domain-containing protein [Marinobacter xestospongiae]